MKTYTNSAGTQFKATYPAGVSEGSEDFKKMETMVKKKIEEGVSGGEQSTTVAQSDV